MLIPVEVLGFLKTHATDRVLSVYVDSAMTEPGRRHEWRAVLCEGIHQVRMRIEQSTQSSRAELEAFERCVVAIEQGLPAPDETPEKAGWMSLCADDGELVEAQLSVAPSAVVRWTEGPILFPYLLATRADNTVIALIELDRARILRLHRGVIHHIEAVDGDTSSDVEASVHRQLSVIAGNHAHLVVGGATGTTTRFVDALPVELAARTVTSDQLRIETPTGDIPSLVFHALTALLTRRQHEMLATLKQRAHLTRNAAIGLDSVIAGAAARAIDQLLISETLWRARPESVEALIHDVLRAGATVDIATPQCAIDLDALGGGIAAQLRFAVTGTARTGSASA